MSPSPGINGVRSNSHHTGTVPKVKCYNHSDVGRDISQHRLPSGGINSGSMVVCSNSINHSISLPPNMRRDGGFSHMNNNLASSMDWQPESSDVTPQSSQLSTTRIRKESNTSASLASYEVKDLGNNSSSSGSTLNGNRTLSGLGSGPGGSTSGSGNVPVIDSGGPGLFYDVPLHNSNHASIDNDEVNQVRWEQEGSGGSGSGGGSVNRRQQKSNNVSERAQVASRLHQIRDYISQTTSVMERLQAAGTPHHMELWLRLHDMLEGLRDSEIKLTAIQRTFDKIDALDNLDSTPNDEEDSNVEDEQEEADCVPKSSDPMTRKNELKVKVEESQRKLIELREQQAVLLALKQKAQEQLKEAKAAEGAVLAAQQEQQREEGNPMVDCSRLEERLQSLQHFYEVRNELAHKVGIGGVDPAVSEVIQLQNKLEELQTKKMQMDQMVVRFDTPNSVASSNQSAVTNSNIAAAATESSLCNNSINTINGISSNNNINSNSGGQTTEDKLAELSLLKEQLARMQNAITHMSKSAATRTLSNSSSTNTSGIIHNSQDSELAIQEDNGELVNLHSSSFSLKQDNRTHEMSQNHQNRQLVQHQPLNPTSVLTQAASSLSGAGGGDTDRSITPTSIIQQQFHAKSVKLQEAKARLLHLQTLLNLVEEFREAGKPVPEKILMLLNSPDGPLSNDDNLDLDSQPVQVQNRQVQSTSSSSSSSLMSLFQPQNNNGCSVSNSTAASVSRDKEATVLPSTNRSDISSIQNLYQSILPTSSSSQSQARQQNQPQHPPIIAKQKNNVTKLCAKTQELKEWMKKDDDPMSCINTDVHSLQQATAGYSTSGFQTYQDMSVAAGVWEHSPDYSSDDGGRSEDDNENDQYKAARKAPPSVSGGNGSVCGADGGNNVGSVSSVPNVPTAIYSSVGNTKDSATNGCSTTNCINSSREVSVDSGLVNVNGAGISVSNAGIFTGPQNSYSSMINPTPCNVWRKHSTGSGCSLPTYSTSNRGGFAPLRSVWTPSCNCSSNNINVNNRVEANIGGGGMNACSMDEGSILSNSNLNHPVDNNTSWVVHQISQLQAQLQQMCQTVTQKCNQGELLMTSPHNLWMPPPATAPSSYCQQPPAITPSLQTPPLGVGALNHYFSGHQHQKQQYQQLLLSSLNQCCQLIWHQQCELSTLKDALHDLQQQQQQYGSNYNYHQVQSSSGHCVGDNTVNETEEQHNLRSNLGRYSQSQPHRRNRIVTDTQPSLSPSSPHPTIMPPVLPPSHFLCPPYTNKLNHGFQPFRHTSPAGSFISSPTGTLNNQVPPGNRANNYWDNFRSYSRQNLLSARSKCNEGRTSSSIPATTTDCSGVSVNSSSRRFPRETQPLLGWGTNIVPIPTPVITAPIPCTSAGGGSTGIVSLQQQPINSFNSAGLDEVATHNLQNQKEKLNTYQGLSTSCLDNRSLPISSVSSRSASHSSLVVADQQQLQQQQQQKQPLISAVNSQNLSTQNNSTLLKSDTTKGACKKSYRAKEQLQGLETKSTVVGISDQINNSHISTSVVSNNNNNINNNNNGRLWNCPSINNQCADSVQYESPSTFNNRQPVQLPLSLGVLVPDDLPRNSNCKRRQLMSTSSVGPTSVVPTSGCNSNVSNKSNSYSGPSSVRTESNDLLLDSLEESMYSEVAALISVNEQRPNYLLQLFKDLKQINSDHGRRAALLSIRNLAAGSPANISNFTAAPSHCQNDEDQPSSINGVGFRVNSVSNMTNENHNNVVEHQNASNVNDFVTTGAISDNGQHHHSTKRKQLHQEVQQQQQQQQQRQPRNIPWRCKKDTTSSSVLPTSCRKLDWEVRSILVNMLPFLKSHFPETCTASLLESVRDLVLQSVPSPQNVPGQLDALLEDALFKFQGCRMQDICDELISVVADVLISELTFIRLATSVNSATSGSGGAGNENDYCAIEDDEEEVEVRTIEEEEGAVGGIERPHDNCQLKMHSNSRHQLSVMEANGCSSKNDPIVSDAELAEADQSSRHSNMVTNGNSLPLMTNSGTITESEQLSSIMTDDKELRSHTSAVDDTNLSSSMSLSVAADKNVSVMLENGTNSNSNGMAENNHQQAQYRNLVSPSCADSPPPLSLIPHNGTVLAGNPSNGIDVWAVEEDRETPLDQSQSIRHVNNSLSDSECKQPYNNDASPNTFSMASTNTHSTNNTNTDENTIAAV